MNAEDKISPAFASFLSDRKPNEVTDAIVIYKASGEVRPRYKGRLRELKKRLDDIKARAAATKTVQGRLFEEYRIESARRMPRHQELNIFSIGNEALPVAKAEVTSRTLEALAEQPDVVAVLPNLSVHSIEPTAAKLEDPSKAESKDGLTWGLKHLDIPRLWEATKGEHINVAVLDTGVYSEHAALQGRVKDFIAYDPLRRPINATPWFDTAQHGTHVCGTIAGGKSAEGISIGVAPEANLFVACVFLGGATVETLVKAMVWAIEKEADIINMSVGFPYYEPKFTNILQLLMDDYGILPVAAIGNDHHGNSRSPGNAHNAFAVGAVAKEASNMTSVAAFSSGVSFVFPGDADHALVTKPDVVAPGVDVYSCIPPQKKAGKTYEYTYMDGTSMAAPHVAGVAALLMAAKPKASVYDIMKAIRETAKHPGGNQLRPDNRWGHGLIQPADALAALD